MQDGIFHLQLMRHCYSLLTNSHDKKIDNQTLRVTQWNLAAQITSGHRTNYLVYWKPPTS
jgi:hypothetical protein